MSTNYIIPLLIRVHKFLKTKVGLFLVLASITVLNIGLYSFSEKISFPNNQVRNDASGLTHFLAKKFVYFYYYTGEFPLATTNTKLIYSKEEALNELSQDGENLIMEFYHWSRLGENARIYAYMPDAWLNSSPKNPSVKLFNCIIFTTALLVLFIGFWISKKATFGLFLVILINTTPFYLYEVFVNQNIFGLLGAAFFTALGLNLYLIFNKKPDIFSSIITCVVSGFFIGLISEFRNEVSVVLMCVVLLYALSNFKSLIYKTTLIILLIFVFSSTKTIIRNHFNTKFEKTAELVALNGGNVYNGAKIKGHNVWHPLFCGLGDFDNKYGYEWNDLTAYKYAIPKLNEQYGMGLNYTVGQYHLNQFYDDEKKYYVKPEELENYESVMKDKVIQDIKNDPFWYLTIIYKRVVRVFTQTVPFSYLGFCALPLLYYLFEQRKWN